MLHYFSVLCFSLSHYKLEKLYYPIKCNCWSFWKVLATHISVKRSRSSILRHGIFDTKAHFEFEKCKAFTHINRCLVKYACMWGCHEIQAQFTVLVWQLEFLKKCNFARTLKPTFLSKYRFEFWLFFFAFPGWCKLHLPNKRNFLHRK